MKGLQQTRRGQANKQLVIDFIKGFLATHQYAPTIREICDGTGIRSSSTVHLHLEALEDEGVLKRNGVKPRGLEIIKTINESVEEQ